MDQPKPFAAVSVGLLFESPEAIRRVRSLRAKSVIHVTGRLLEHEWSDMLLPQAPEGHVSLVAVIAVDEWGFVREITSVSSGRGSVADTLGQDDVVPKNRAFRWQVSTIRSLAIMGICILVVLLLLRHRSRR